MTAERARLAHKPGSVSAIKGRMMIISLAPMLPSGSSDRTRPALPALVLCGEFERTALSHPKDGRRGLLGLAPGGVYRASGVATGAVSSYLTVSPLP